MMEQLQVGDQIVLYDRLRTEAAYAGLDGGDADRCGCSYCWNFATQRSIAYPESFRGILNQLGIDIDKESEVYECGPNGALREYGGWFHLSGQLIQPGEPKTIAGFGFHFYFADAKTLPRPAGDFGEHVLALEFSGAKVPWVLAERP